MVKVRSHGRSRLHGIASSIYSGPPVATSLPMLAVVGIRYGTLANAFLEYENTKVHIYLTN